MIRTHSRKGGWQPNLMKVGLDGHDRTRSVLPISEISETDIEIPLRVVKQESLGI